MNFSISFFNGIVSVEIKYDREHGRYITDMQINSYHYQYTLEVDEFQDPNEMESFVVNRLQTSINQIAGTRLFKRNCEKIREFVTNCIMYEFGLIDDDTVSDNFN